MEFPNARDAALLPVEVARLSFNLARSGLASLPRRTLNGRRSVRVRARHEVGTVKAREPAISRGEPSGSPEQLERELGPQATKNVRPAQAANTGLPFHPLCMQFDFIRGTEFDRFVADIKTGLLEPIVMFEGQILDGKNRYRACLTAKVEPKFEDFTGTEAEAAAFVERKNFHRRHMTPSQKRDHADALLKANPARSDRSIAEEAKVDRETVSRNRKRLEATGGLPPVEKRVGADGKARKQPAKRAKRSADDFVADIKAKSNQLEADKAEVRRLDAAVIEAEFRTRRLRR